MKILKICSLNYNSVISAFYRRYPELKALSYAEHKSKLLQFSPVHLNRFSSYMQELGYECDEVVVDLESLQKSWMLEAGHKIPDESWRLEILFKQIESHRPDILYLQDLSAIPPAWRRRLKDYYPFLKGVVLYRGFPIVQEGVEDVDLILSGAHNLIRTYEERGMNVRYLPHAFEPSILVEIDRWDHRCPATRSDFSFFGYSGYSGHGIHHAERYQFLEKLMQNTPLHCWLAEYSTNQTPDPRQNNTPFYIGNQRCREGLMGLELYQAIRSSKIVFNRHSTAFPGQVENMRLFEVTGIGSCLLTDDGENLPQLFERDVEVLTYHSYDECIEKLQYLLENESSRKAIASAGQTRTLKQHTWKHRCEAVHAYLQEVFR